MDLMPLMIDRSHANGRSWSYRDEFIYRTERLLIWAETDFIATLEAFDPEVLAFVQQELENARAVLHEEMPA